MSEPLLTATHDRVRVLTLNRPEARNALSSDLVSRLYAAVRAADADANVSAIVLTGSDPAFCAGVDLKELARDGEKYLARFDTEDCIRQVALLGKPVIGAINGATFTGGLELALGCDFLIASDRAAFADTHIRVGVLPGGGMTARLSRRIGSAYARRLSLTGEVIDAAEALRAGLVTEVVPHEQLRSRALQLATAIAEVDLDLLRPLKQQYTEGDRATLEVALSREREIAAATAIAFDQVDGRRRAVMSRNREQLPPVQSGDNQSTDLV
jgi:enoyl-CoA hydratase/carnithine racemase